MVFMPTSTSGQSTSARLKPNDGRLPLLSVGSFSSAGIGQLTKRLIKLPYNGPAISMPRTAATRPMAIIQPKSAFICAASSIGTGPGSRKEAAAATPANKGMASLTILPSVRRATANTMPISSTTATSKNSGRAQINPAIPSA
ncbi:hypothetical protein D3C71_1633420 [compost metagenome]